MMQTRVPTTQPIFETRHPQVAATSPPVFTQPGAEAKAAEAAGFTPQATPWGMPQVGSRVEMPGHHGILPRCVQAAMVPGYSLDVKPPVGMPRVGEPMLRHSVDPRLGHGRYNELTGGFDGPGAAQIREELKAEKEKDDKMRSDYILRVKLPVPMYKGGTEFIDNVPKRSATFAWSETCITPSPESSLAPTPHVEQKSWYNTYVYVPETKCHDERHFLERFVEGEDGEWVDTVKAQRMSQFLDERGKEAEQEALDRELALAGADIEQTDYVDAYSGEPMARFHGELMPKESIRNQFEGHRSPWKDFVYDIQTANDYGNLRVAWPFAHPDRNKHISQHVYNWYDRRNRHIPTDSSYEIMQLPSTYAEKNNYEKWRPNGGGSPVNFVQDVACRAQYFDDYPYVQ